MNDKIKTSWTINALLAVILVLLGGLYMRSLPSAHAASWDTDGLMVLPARGPAERLVLIDTKKQNIMLYRERQNGGFALTGARSYKYDVEIEDSEGRIKGNGWTYLEAMVEYEKAKK